MKTLQRAFLWAPMAALLLAALARPAHAESGAQSFGITNALAANATTTANLGGGIKIDAQDNVGVVFKYQGNGTGTGNIVLTFVRSADGLTWETTPTIKKTNALANATAQVAYFNLSQADIGAAPWIKVSAAQNYDASVSATNCSLILLTKTLKAAP